MKELESNQTQNNLPDLQESERMPSTKRDRAVWVAVLPLRMSIYLLHFCTS